MCVLFDKLLVDWFAMLQHWYNSMKIWTIFYKRLISARQVPCYTERTSIHRSLFPEQVVFLSRPSNSNTVVRNHTVYSYYLYNILWYLLSIMYFFCFWWQFTLFSICYIHRLELKLNFDLVQNQLFIENVPFLKYLIVRKLISKVVDGVVLNSYFLLWSFMKYVKMHHISGLNANLTDVIAHIKFLYVTSLLK